MLFLTKSVENISVKIIYSYQMKQIKWELKTENQLPRDINIEIGIRHDYIHTTSLDIAKQLGDIPKSFCRLEIFRMETQWTERVRLKWTGKI